MQYHNFQELKKYFDEYKKCDFNLKFMKEYFSVFELKQFGLYISAIDDLLNSLSAELRFLLKKCFLDNKKEYMLKKYAKATFYKKIAIAYSTISKYGNQFANILH
ncbi:MAG: hypothetical protein LBH55_04160 [Mycoplasmataceae bacterium]|jgi:hypothetical protein|nr:hypothetical protein [Mycoplasmataceae bacterium]